MEPFEYEPEEPVLGEGMGKLVNQKANRRESYRTLDNAIERHIKIARTEIENATAGEYDCDECGKVIHHAEYWRGRVYGLMQARAIVRGEDASHGAIFAAVQEALR